GAEASHQRCVPPTLSLGDRRDRPCQATRRSRPTSRRGNSGSTSATNRPARRTAISRRETKSTLISAVQGCLAFSQRPPVQLLDGTKVGVDDRFLMTILQVGIASSLRPRSRTAK